jgi:hypothetical protein
MERKDEDNVTARKLDPSYSYQQRTDTPLPLDPALISAESDSEAEKRVAKQKADEEADLPAPSLTETQPKRSVVVEMFGLPSDQLERDRLTPSLPTPDAATRRPILPSDAETGAASHRGVPDLGTGKARVSKSAHGFDAAGHAGPPPAARDGAADGKDPAVPDDHRAQPTARGQLAVTENRNLNPYGASSMRPTGLRDPSSFVDPRTGLPSGQGRAATVGTPYLPPNPYAPVVQAPGAGAARTTTPPRPLFAPPPGNRYDGGRGYGN